MPTLAPTETPSVEAAPTTMHVSDLDGTTVVGGSNGRWEAAVTVTVLDANGDPVEYATVTIGWDNGKSSGAAACTTAASGQCSVSEKNSKKRSSIAFTVDNVTHATLSYDAAGNHDPDGDSDGTTITVSKPW